MECVPGVCACGDKCTNQRIGQSKGADVVPFFTESARYAKLSADPRPYRLDMSLLVHSALLPFVCLTWTNDMVFCLSVCRGWGLKCNHDLQPGQFVIEYQGEIITGDKCEQRMNQYRREGESHFYMFCVSTFLVSFCVLLCCCATL